MELQLHPILLLEDAPNFSLFGVGESLAALVWYEQPHHADAIVVNAAIRGFCGQAQGPTALLVIVSSTSDPPDAETRAVFGQNKSTLDRLAGIAVVGELPGVIGLVKLTVARMIKFVFALTMPMRLFRSTSEALDWLSARLELDLDVGEIEATIAELRDRPRVPLSEYSQPTLAAVRDETRPDPR